MSKPTERLCPDCSQVKEFRSDQRGCGCIRRGEVVVQTQKEPTESSEISGNDWTISIPKSRIHTLEQLVEYFQVDTDVWEVEKFVCNKWEVAARVTTRDEDDPEIVTSSMTVEPLFQVKAWLKRKANVADAKKEIEELKELAKGFAPTPRKIPVVKNQKGHLLELSLYDHHWGKLAWPDETGHKPYDTKLATQLWWKAFDSILARTSGYKFDEIWLVVGNDILNSDDREGRTTRGTHVNSDTRYQKTFSEVRNTMIESIERLRELCNRVRVIMVSGNHDYLSVWHMGNSLESYFHKYTDVEIDNDPKYFKYKQFGQVMICYTHGDKGKRNDYPLLMATEQPEMFGATRYREVHCGHKHYSKLDEHHGIRVRQFSSLSAPDAWHAENAFVGNLRVAEGLIWNKDEGLIATVFYTDPEDKNG